MAGSDKGPPRALRRRPAVLGLPYAGQAEYGGISIERVGDALWLAADLQEPCFVGAHLTMVLLVSLPQILLYTVGLPLAATISCIVVRSVSETSRCSFVGGCST